MAWRLPCTALQEKRRGDDARIVCACIWIGRSCIRRPGGRGFGDIDFARCQNLVAEPLQAATATPPVTAHLQFVWGASFHNVPVYFASPTGVLLAWGSLVLRNCLQPSRSTWKRCFPLRPLLLQLPRPSFLVPQPSRRRRLPMRYRW